MNLLLSKIRIYFFFALGIGTAVVNITEIHLSKKKSKKSKKKTALFDVGRVSVIIPFKNVFRIG